MTADHTATQHRQSRLPEVPEPGRVVEVRGATWAVADVRAQGLPRSPADEAVPSAQHVVTLQASKRTASAKSSPSCGSSSSVTPSSPTRACPRP